MAKNTYTYLEGTMFFPFLFENRDKFDNYSVALGLEGDQVKQARKIGLNVKQDANKMDGMAYVQLRSNHKPDLFNAAGEEYDGPTMLSNGSKGTVKVSQRPYDNKFGKGVTTFLVAVKITDPIEFVPDGNGVKRPFHEGEATSFDTLDDEAPF